MSDSDSDRGSDRSNKFKARRNSSDSDRSSGDLNDKSLDQNRLDQEDDSFNMKAADRPRQDSLASSNSDANGATHNYYARDDRLLSMYSGGAEPVENQTDPIRDSSKSSQIQAPISNHNPSTITVPPRRQKLTDSDDDLNQIDLVEQLALSKKKDQIRDRKRRRCFQCLIFCLCYIICFSGIMRQKYIDMALECNTSGNNLDQQVCDDFLYSIAISSGIGYVFLGNIYDNIGRPRLVTVLIMITLCFLSLIQAIFGTNTVNSYKENSITDLNLTQSNDTIQATSNEAYQVAVTLYQMSTVFEAGLNLACIVIIHNWFKSNVLGTFSALFMTSSYLQMAIQAAIWQSQGSPSILANTSELLAQHTLVIESYTIAGAYLILGIVCYFLFYHHPNHIGIKIRKTQNNSHCTGFNVDYTSKWLEFKQLDEVSGPGQRTHSGRITSVETGFTGQVSQSQKEMQLASLGSSGQEQQTNKNQCDVTLIDAFVIKELNLLILSYLFRQSHNEFIIDSSEFYQAINNISDMYYGIGGCIGLVATGLCADFIQKGQNYFMSIAFLNVVLLLWDIFLFSTTAGNFASELWVENLLSVILGAILASADLIYLILIPMLIAKQHAAKMAFQHQTLQANFSGTIVGVTLAMCQVGKYLFSCNLASLLVYLTQKADTAIWADLVAVFLLICTNLMLLKPIIEEFRQTELYKKQFRKRNTYGDDRLRLMDGNETDRFDETGTQAGTAPNDVHTIVQEENYTVYRES